MVETLRKALVWRQELDAGTVAIQADIARREGVTRARVTQVLMLVRLAPGIQERVLALPATAERPVISERPLRPITRIENPTQQIKAFDAAMATGDRNAKSAASIWCGFRSTQASKSDWDKRSTPSPPWRVSSCVKYRAW